MRLFAVLFAVLLLFSSRTIVLADQPEAVLPAHVARIKDVTTVEGIRDNQLIGYGLVVGLAGTGDKQQTIFSVQTLGSMLQRMGLNASDGKVYAVAQGSLILGGYSAGSSANAKVVNHPTVGRIPSGALVERDTSVDLSKFESLSFLLRDPDFVAATDVADAINHLLGKGTARVIDSRRIELDGIATSGTDVPTLMARIGELTVRSKPAAKVVVNERTGTIVMGGAVTISSCSILHGNLSIQVTTEFQVSQPAPFSKTGQTAVVPQTTVQAQESPLQVVQLKEGATVEELIRGLQTIGASARDIVAILQAIKAANALNAELEVL